MEFETCSICGGKYNTEYAHCPRCAPPKNNSGRTLGCLGAGCGGLSLGVIIFLCIIIAMLLSFIFGIFGFFFDLIFMIWD